MEGCVKDPLVTHNEIENFVEPNSGDAAPSNIVISLPDLRGSEISYD